MNVPGDCLEFKGQTAIPRAWRVCVCVCVCVCVPYGAVVCAAISNR